jgi:hypothetical protein
MFNFLCSGSYSIYDVLVWIVVIGLPLFLLSLGPDD